jgi:Mg2+ and Co2+ transporter CorA
MAEPPEIYDREREPELDDDWLVWFAKVVCAMFGAALVLVIVMLVIVG